jgi:hypothetical protein
MRTLPSQTLFLLFAMVVTILQVAVAAAQDPPADQSPETAATKQAIVQDEATREKLLLLVMRLESKSLSERELAEEELLKVPQGDWDKLGFELPIAGETKARLERIRLSVELKHAKEGVEPTRVTIEGKENLGAALADLQAKTTNEIGEPPSPNVPVNVAIQDLTFWMALDRLLDNTSLDVAEFTEDGSRKLNLIERNDARPLRASAAYTGIFRLEVDGVSARGSLRKPNMNSLSMQVEIAWEPRVQPIRLALPMSQLKCVLDTGQELLPTNLEAEPETAGAQGSYQTELSLNLEKPPRDAKSIQRLSGVLRGTLPGRKTTLRVPFGVKEPVHRGGVSLRLDGVRKAGVLDEVRFRLKIDQPADSLQSHQFWIFQNDAFIETANGERKDRVGLEVYAQSSDEVGIALLFDLEHETENAVFVYETPLAVVAGEWPFEIKEIPLP